MNKQKLLDQLIEEIVLIDALAFEAGEAPTSREFNKADKGLAKHKTKAFQIIEKLRLII